MHVCMHRIMLILSSNLTTMQRIGTTRASSLQGPSPHKSSTQSVVLDIYNHYFLPILFPYNKFTMSVSPLRFRCARVCRILTALPLEIH